MDLARTYLKILTHAGGNFNGPGRSAPIIFGYNISMLNASGWKGGGVVLVQISDATVYIWLAATGNIGGRCGTTLTSIYPRVHRWALKSAKPHGWSL